MLGNGLTLSVVCSSSTMRNNTVNMFLMSQSMLHFLCALFLIATAWDVVWSTQSGISGRFPFP